MPAASQVDRTPVARVLDALAPHRAGIADEAVARIRAEIPGYAELDVAQVADVRAHVEEHFEPICRAIVEDRLPAAEELAFMEPHISKRVRKVGLTDFMQAFRIYIETFWGRLSEVGAGFAPGAVIAAGAMMIRYSHLAAGMAAERYVEYERLLQAPDEQERRDLFEDLMAGRPAIAGPKLGLAREAGLEPPQPCVVIVAVPVKPLDDEDLLHVAALALVRRVGGVRPLAILRRKEVAVVAPAGREPSAVLSAVRAAHAKLAGDGIAVAIGVSTVLESLVEIADAYAEASSAAQRVGGTGGVVALPELTVFDCLIGFGIESARRRVPRPIREFAARDDEQGGVLTQTLLAYFAADCNAKLTASRLHLHPNTARYRLAKIGEQTGCDLRRVSEVLDLVIAFRTAGRLSSAASPER